jgi:hypothetical protein
MGGLRIIKMITSHTIRTNPKDQALPEQPITQLELFAETVPGRPYCTDALGQLRILPAVKAFEKRYIQPNSPWDLRWLVYDVDRPTLSYKMVI